MCLGVLNKHIKSSHEEKKLAKSYKPKKKRLLMGRCETTETKEGIVILPQQQAQPIQVSME
jgi:hypothetical protein